MDQRNHHQGLENRALIGVDLGGTKVAAGRVVDGTVVEEIVKPIDATLKDPRDTIGLMAGMIRNLTKDGVSGIGIGVPGPVDREQGIVYDVLNIPAWKEVHLKTILEEECGLPVCIDNDSNCFAMGEYWYGACTGENDFTGITLGTGMGTGIVKDGKLLLDAHGCSGEFGTMPYLDGIYENYTSGMFFYRRFDQSGQEVATAAMKGEPWAVDAFSEFGMHLGNAIKAIIMAVDPPLVIIGGSVAKAHPLFEDAMRKSITEIPFQSVLGSIQVKFSEKENMAILGAASLCHAPRSGEE